MRYRPLGESGIEASIVAFGAWAIGGWKWGGTDEAAAVDAIHAAVDCGMTFIDTAPVYGFGTSEEIVGKAIKGLRDKVVLATKCGLNWTDTRGEFFFETEMMTSKGIEGKARIYRNLSPEAIRGEIEQSLSRLGTDYIDLYQTHWQDKTTPIEETMAELEKLRDEGKIRAIGCSNATTGQMDRYRKAGALSSDQEQFSMLDRKHLKSNLPYCARNRVAYLAYSPIAQGLLTGKMGPDRTFAANDQRLDNPRFSIENRARVAGMLDRFRPIADGHGISLTQLTIAWTVSMPGCTHALVGARNPEQVEENARAGDVALSKDDIDTMNAIIEESAV